MVLINHCTHTHTHTTHISLILLVVFVNAARSVDDKTNELLVGNCTPDEPLIHAETIVVNNDGRSRLTGNIRVNVEAPVNITCVKLVNQADNASGVLAHLVEGGVGHNYVVFGVDTAFGQSINYFVQIFGA